MKVKDLGNCVRPLIFENNNDLYKYTFGGSCFLIVFNEKLFAITASHLLPNLCYDVQSIRIPPHLENPNKFLPISQSIMITEPKVKDCDFADILVIEIDQKRMGNFSVYDLQPYNLTDDIATMFSFYPDAKLLIRGYPKTIEDIDYAKKYIGTKGLLVTGNYMKAHESQKYCHLFTYDGLTDVVPSSNGMSGAPVFQIEEKTYEKSTARLAGVIIKGDDAQNIGYFVEATVLIEMFGNKLKCVNI